MSFRQMKIDGGRFLLPISSRQIDVDFYYRFVPLDDDDEKVRGGGAVWRRRHLVATILPPSLLNSDEPMSGQEVSCKMGRHHFWHCLGLSGICAVQSTLSLCPGSTAAAINWR